MEIKKLNRNDLDCLEITEEDGKYEGGILIDPTLFNKIQKEDLARSKRRSKQLWKRKAKKTY